MCVLLVSYTLGLSKMWFHINVYFRDTCLNQIKTAEKMGKKLFCVNAQGKCSLLVQMSRFKVNICALILEVKELSETAY